MNDYEFTMEYFLKMYKTKDMGIEESIYQRLEENGFNNLHDVINNPNSALKLLGTDEEEMINFRSSICNCLKIRAILPLHFNHRFTFTENTIKKVKDIIEKDKLSKM